MPWDLGSGLTFGGKVRVAATEPSTLGLALGVEAFGSRDCSGASIDASAASPPVEHLAADWRVVVGDFGSIPPSARSLRFSVEVENQGDSAAEVWVDDVFLYWGRVFGDSFETGDMFRWSQTVP